jgi:hypothetical protein
MARFVNASRREKVIFRDVELNLSAPRAGLERSKDLSNIFTSNAEFDVDHSHKMMVG